MTVAVLCTGLIGSTIAENLLDCKEEVVAWNRSTSRRLPEHLYVPTANEAVARADAVFVCPSDDWALGQVLASLRPETVRGKTFFLTATVSPEAASMRAAELWVHGARSFTTPILGSLKPLADRTAVLLVGCAKDTIVTMEELAVLRHVTNNVQLVHGHAAAMRLKLAVNMLLGATTLALAEALAFLQKTDVPTFAFFEALADSPLSSPYLLGKLSAMRDTNPAPAAFPLKHMLKDLRLAQEAGTYAPLTAAGVELFSRAVEAGFGEGDVAGVARALWPPEGPSS